MKTLFVNTCVREESRTRILADHYLAHAEGEIVEIHPVKEGLYGLDREMLKERDRALAGRNHEHPVLAYARQFAEAEEIVIAAPYWDLSFPAALKNYIERVNCVGITFDYDEKGNPFGLCKAKKLVYITTSGGCIVDDAYGFGYIRALCENFYGIPEVLYYKAEGLDLPDTDIEDTLQAVMRQMDAAGQ